MAWALHRGKTKESAGDLLGLGERRQRPTFFLEFTALFAVLALVLTVAAAFAVTRFLGGDIRDRVLDDVQTEVSEVTARQISANLSAETLAAPLSGQALATFDSFVQENILTPRTVRLNVWNRESTLIYSSYGSLIGSSLVSEEVDAALAGQTTAAVEGTGDEPERAGFESIDQVVEVYVPLTSGDPPQTVGAIEVYRDYSPIAAHIGGIQRTVFISIAVALGALYLVLVFLVRRGSNTIVRQRQDLETRAKDLRNSYESIVAVLCAALDLRDNVTLGHAQRVSELASVVAWQLGLRKEQVRRIEKAAILHDIGKIGVADAVLSKPGPLDEGEWAEMKRHPELGYEILKGIDFLKEAAEIVYAHHEWFDGNGYPRGLKEDEIPLGARIFAVVDAYDAMTSHRPYRKAMPHKKAVADIVRNTGTQFDPQVVKAFLEAERRGLLDGRHREEDVDEAVASSTADR